MGTPNPVTDLPPPKVPVVEPADVSAQSDLSTTEPYYSGEPEALFGISFEDVFELRSSCSPCGAWPLAANSC